jgi:hypothetical protein
MRPQASLSCRRGLPHAFDVHAPVLCCALLCFAPASIRHQATPMHAYPPCTLGALAAVSGGGARVWAEQKDKEVEERRRRLQRLYAALCDSG